MRSLLAIMLVGAMFCQASLRAERGSPEQRPEVVQMAGLLAMRLAMAREVAWSKACAGIPIADPAREAAHLAALRHEGVRYSMTAERVTALFLPQIVASRRYQQELVMQWRSGFPRPKNPPLDITRELRPRIDALDTDILRCWAAFPRDQLDEWSRDSSEEILRSHGIPAAVAGIAVSPLGGPGPGLR